MLEQTKAWFEAGHSHYEAGRWAEAADALERALAADPAQPEAWYRLGNARQEQGRHEVAGLAERQVLEAPLRREAGAILDGWLACFAKAGR
jgi:tetratricopeptide (TPR) repeat protein